MRKTAGVMIKVFTANRPPLPEYENKDQISSMPLGEIHRITAETGNHWRKIFNVYAKFMYSLAISKNDADILQYKTWQCYRDERLLQGGSDTQLHFSHVALAQCLLIVDAGAIRIVMGKAFSESLLADAEMTWVDKDFAINKKLSIIVCPYFDYRQLSNVKIAVLVNLVLALSR
jgi:hypothetical protein